MKKVLKNEVHHLSHELETINANPEEHHAIDTAKNHGFTLLELIHDLFDIQLLENNIHNGQKF